MTTVQGMFRSPMTLGTSQRVSTVFVLFLLPLTLTPAIVLGLRVAAIPGALATVALIVAWAMSPRELVVTDDEVQITRRAWLSARVPRLSIASASTIDSLGAGTLRLFGVGGFFGSHGLFQNGTLGRFRLYGTRSGNAVLLRRRGGALPIVVTPDDVGGALASLQP